MIKNTFKYFNLLVFEKVNNMFLKYLLLCFLLEIIFLVNVYFLNVHENLGIEIGIAILLAQLYILLNNKNMIMVKSLAINNIKVVGYIYLYTYIVYLIFIGIIFLVELFIYNKFTLNDIVIIMICINISNLLLPSVLKRNTFWKNFIIVVSLVAVVTFILNKIQINSEFNIKFISLLISNIITFISGFYLSLKNIRPKNYS